MGGVVLRGILSLSAVDGLRRSIDAAIKRPPHGRSDPDPRWAAGFPSGLEQAGRQTGGLT